MNDQTPDLRAQLLDALDFAYCQGLGYDTPEALLAVYDAERGVPVPPPADQTALRQRIAGALYERERPPRDPAWAEAFAMDREVFEAMADAVLAVLPEHSAAGLAAIRPQTLTALASHIDARAVAILRSDSQTYAEWQAMAALLRRVAAEEQPAPCAECSHPKAEHREGEDPVTPGQCGACLDDDARHDHRPAVGEQPETQETQPCGSAHPGSGFALGVRCTLEAHSGDHGHDEEIPGTGHTVQLRWPNQARP